MFRHQFPKVAKRDLKEEVLELKQQSGKDILVGSRSLIVSLMELHLIDEYQLCAHPVIAGNGLPLLKYWKWMANLSDESKSKYKQYDIPWWRVLKDGKPSKYMPEGIENQRKIFKSEGGYYIELLTWSIWEVSILSDFISHTKVTSTIRLSLIHLS